MRSLINPIACCLVLYIFGCTENTGRNTEGIITIDLESNIKNFKPMKLSEIASSVDYIPLQSSSDFMIGYIGSIDVSEQFIVVGAKQGMDTKILLFDNKGNYIREIGRQGKGPGEYQITGRPYFLDDCIYVPSVIGKPNVLIYDITGKFIKACSYPLHHISSIHSNWLPISPNEFLLQVPNNSGDQDFRIIKVDCQGKTLKGFPNSMKFQPFNPNVFSTDSQASQFYIFDDKIRYKEVRNDTTWELSDEKLKARYIIYRGRFGSNVDFRSLPVEKFNEDKVRIIRIFETRKFMFFETLFKKLYPFNFYMEYNMITGTNRSFTILGVYNKELGNTYFVKPSNIDDLEFPPGIPTGLENDMDGGINFFPTHKASDSVLVSWIDAYKLNEYIASEAFQKAAPIYTEKKKDLEKLASSLSENDNPVLMVVKLK